MNPKRVHVPKWSIFRGTWNIPGKYLRAVVQLRGVADLAELSETAKADVDSSVGEETMNEEGEVSLDEVSNSEEPTQENTPEDQ